MPRRMLIILKGFRGENYAISTVYITDLQLPYILQADALKFDFKLTNKKKSCLQQSIFRKVFNGYW